MSAKTISTNSIDSLLRLEQVMSITSLCRSHVFLLIKEGKFPSSITIIVRVSRWSEREVRQWVADQIANARKSPAPTAPILVTRPVTLIGGGQCIGTAAQCSNCNGETSRTTGKHLLCAVKVTSPFPSNVVTV